MKLHLIPACLAVGLASLSLTGCGSSTKLTTSQEASVGQQLSDLDNAYRQGIISEREYKRLKSALIRRYD